MVIKYVPYAVRQQDESNIVVPIVAHHAIEPILIMTWLYLIGHVSNVKTLQLNPTFTKCHFQ